MKRETVKRLERLEQAITRDELDIHSSSDNHSPEGSPRGTDAIDLVTLESLCMLHCTDQEIASYFGVTTERIEQERQSPAFTEVMQRGQAKGKIAIRRGQMRLLEKGSSMMAVLLGRQILGQREELRGEEGTPIPIVIIPPPDDEQTTPIDIAVPEGKGKEPKEAAGSSIDLPAITTPAIDSLGHRRHR